MDKEKYYKYIFYHNCNSFIGIPSIPGALYYKENYYNIYGEPLYIYINGKSYKRIRDSEVDENTIYFEGNPYKKSLTMKSNDRIIRI